MKNFRKWLANKLASVARRIYPASEEVMSFYMDRMTEAVILGQTAIKVTVVPPEDLIRFEPGTDSVTIKNVH